MGLESARIHPFLLNSELPKLPERAPSALDVHELAAAALSLMASEIRRDRGFYRCRQCEKIQPADWRPRLGRPSEHYLGCYAGLLRDKLMRLYGADPARAIAVAIASSVEQLAGEELRRQEQAAIAVAYAEPWAAQGVGLEISGETVDLVTSGPYPTPLEMLVPGVVRRVAACVNFCQGITTDAIEASEPLAGYRDEKGGVL
jgi:hypothetical protein